jgi:hypothetical protein
MRNSFGLDDKYIESVYEEFFILKYYGNWSLTEAYNLPVVIRRWFLKRLSKQIEDENDAVNNAQASSKKR